MGTTIVVAASIAWLAPPDAIAADAWRALVVALAAIAFWAAAILPEDVTGLAFFAIATVLAIAPTEVIFAGFHSPAVWLVFGGLIIGAAVAATGLDRVLALRFRPLFRHSYARCLALAVVMAITLALVVPSTMTRVILLVPVIAALAEELGYARGSNGHIGMVLAGIMASYYPTVAILPATVPTVALVGTADALHDVRLSYAELLWTHGPTLTLLRAAMLVAILAVLFPAPAPRAPAPATAPAADARQPRLALLLALALVLWATDALHGIAPAWIALATGVSLILPRLGVFSPNELQSKVNLRPGFYVAAILGVGAVVAHTGVGNAAIEVLAERGWLRPEQDLLNMAILTPAALATGALATMPAIAAVLVPVAQDVAQATGLPLETIFKTYVLGYATAFLPYQVPPMIVGLGLAGVGIAAASRATLAIALASATLLWPLSLLWWWVIG